MPASWIHRSGRRLLLTAVLTTALTGAGCSGGGPTELNLIANSADAAADAGSFRMTMSMIGSGGGESFSMSGDGIFGNEPVAGRMSMRMDMFGEDVAIEMIFLGETLYMNMGGVVPGLASTPWVSVDLSEAGGGGMLEGMSGTGTDPRQFLEMLRGAGRAEVVGRDVVRGVDTTHYRAQVKLSEAIASAPESQREQLRESMAAFAAGGALEDLEFPVEAWIDDEGLPRRLVMALDLGSLGVPGAGGSMEISMEMFDYGVDVDVTAPPAAQVTPIG